MMKGVIRSSRKRQSKSRSSPTDSETRASKVEDKAAKSNKPLQKTGLSPFKPLDSPRVKRIVINFGGVVSWVLSHTNAFSHQFEAKNPTKREYVGPYRSNPSVSARSPGRRRRVIPVFHNSCLSPGVRPPTKSTRNGGGDGGSSALTWEWIRAEAANQGRPENCPGRTIDSQTTPGDLLGISETVGKHFEQVILLSNFPSNMTGWETISEAIEFTKYALTILNRIFEVVGDKSESDNPSNSIESAEVPCTIDTEADGLYLSLCNSFDKRSPAASEFCVHAISMLANCLEDCRHIKSCVIAFQVEAMLEFVETYSGITRIQEEMIIKRKGELAVISWSIEQEENRFDDLLKPVESISECVITIQTRILQSAHVEPPGIGTLNEEASKLESHLQQCWTCLIRISKRVGVLCPRRKQVLYVYLLERFIHVTCELSRYQKLLPVLNEAHCKERLARAASSCQRMLLKSLMQLFEFAEEVGLTFKKEGLVSVFDFCKTADASQIYSITLTLLLSAVAEQTGTIIAQSQHFSETLKMYGAELMCFVKPCVEVIDFVVKENAARTSGTNESAGDVCDDQDIAHSKLPELVNVGSPVGSTVELPEVIVDDNKERIHKALNSASGRRSPRLLRRRSVPKTAARSKPTPFGSPENYPEVKPPEEAAVGDAALASHTIVGLDSFESSSEEADKSLDRRLPPMPSLGHFNRVNINSLSELGDLGEGASGEVRLMMWNNRKVAVKRLTCKNPIRARSRLEKEATVHERIGNGFNIVPFRGRAVETDESGEEQIVGIIMDWCPLGDLYKAIRKAESIKERDLNGEDISAEKDSVAFQLYKDWGKRLQIIADIAAGMVSMHKRNFVHRDLTSWNVLLKSTGNCGEYEIYICDFERCYYLPDGESIKRTKARANSVPYMGSEVLRNESYGLKADVYSIGTILWELMFLEDPQTHLKKRFGADESAILFFLSEGRISLLVSEDDAPDVPEFPDLVRLVKRAWTRDPVERPTMSEFFKEVMEICTRMKERLSSKCN